MFIASQNTLIETPRVMCDDVYGRHGPANLTHETNHHTKCASYMCCLPQLPHLKMENDVFTVTNWGKNKRVKYMNHVWHRVSIQ